MKKNKTMGHIVRIGITIAIILVIFFLYAKLTSPKTNYDGFAKCIAEKGMVMYGTEWCPYCSKQKSMFQDSFQHVNFIDCDYQGEVCDNAGVTGYPTWELDGELYKGVYSLKELGRITGCSLN